MNGLIGAAVVAWQFPAVVDRSDYRAVEVGYLSALMAHNVVAAGMLTAEGCQAAIFVGPWEDNGGNDPLTRVVAFGATFDFAGSEPIVDDREVEDALTIRLDGRAFTRFLILRRPSPGQPWGVCSIGTGP